MSGFIPSVIDEENHFIAGDGCLPTDVIFPDGHGWGDFLPPATYQNKNGLETEACTIFAPLRDLASVGKKKFGSTFQNFLSARFNAILAHIGPNGADPHTSMEIIRKYGVIPEVFFPFDNQKTWQEYYSPNPPPLNLLVLGQHWLKKYTFGHEWVFKDTDTLEGKQAAMKYALRFSPLTVATFAWSKHGDGLYYKDQAFDDHYVNIYDFVEGQYWLAYDSYDEIYKKLAWSTNFDQCKRIHLALNLSGEGQEADLSKDNWLVDIFGRLKSFLLDILYPR